MSSNLEKTVQESNKAQAYRPILFGMDRFENPLEGAKSWDKSLEPVIFKRWESEGLGKFDVNSSKQIFVIDTPPPYPSGRPWHVGGASHYTLIDMIARSARMRGFEVLFPIGIDRNGLPVEIYTEKKYKVSIKTTPREEFLELCKIALDDLEQEMIQTLKMIGVSGNYEQKYRTDEVGYRALTQSTFISQWKDDRVYEGTRPTNYCVDCGTTIADAEIIYSELPTKLVFFMFMTKDGGFIPIASTRPELLCSCQAVIVNPEDERFKSFIGKTAIVPFYGREVPIREHSSAKPEFGTGAVMVCSYGDYNDVQLFRELGLKEIIAIGRDGRMLEPAGSGIAGLRIKQARNAMLERLEKDGISTKVEEVQHRTPMCERSKTPVEIIPMDEYYLKVIDVKGQLEHIARKELHFHPEMHRTILLNWIEVARDWPISRRRFYGTEVPVWYCTKCKEPFLPPAGPYYQPWRDPPPGNPSCSRCGSKDFVGDNRTFDTWMDSSVSALYVTKYNRDEKFHERTYPASIRPQGKDIIRTWLHYSILRCTQITGMVPWKDVWITGWGLDEKGEKMSKSKGNAIDPLIMLDRYGAENFRMWIASEVSIGSDYTCSESKIATPGKFLTKLWNISRFIAGFPVPEEKPSYDDISPSDRWILSELSSLTEECIKGYEDYNFFIPANRIRDFTWNIFAAHYVEIAKVRAYGSGFSQKEIVSARYALHQCLRSILLLLAPICPFITEALWLKVYSSQSIHSQTFPDSKNWDSQYLAFEKQIVDFNSKVWNEKKARGLSLKESIQMEIPAELQEFASDLKAMHNI
ncbi:MAG TPA: valine--tRNA ligase [Nitrososphaerales archaeon]|nr:valine--tRNA ligase [Nitrososphaerales archaeon]